jgi:ribosomal protein S27AE
MRRVLALLALLVVPLAAAAQARPPAVLDVVYARSVYILADGSALVIEESTEPPRAAPAVAPAPPPAVRPNPPARPAGELAGGAVLRPAGGPAAPFRDGSYNPSHTCPNCGYTSPAGGATWVKRGDNPDGTHNHQCPKCGTSWRH